jgi:aldehyde:ferredoxin oxidoreductase
MPGCVIQCSNVYVDEHGKEVVAPLEYETLGLMGTNCGFKEPDVVARLNAAANELGIDSIEFGAMMGMLMGAGQAAFGDAAFVDRALEDLRLGNERGRILAQGCARVAEHYGISRAPVIKRQAMSAYDPRVIEVTGVSMRTSAQGADHTSGAVPLFTGQTLEEVATASFNAQVNAMIGDTLGMCLLGRGVHDIRRDILVDAVAAFHGIKIDPSWLNAMGREGLKMERQFNREAGFTEADDEAPAFLRDEPLPPTNRTARFTAGEINSVFARLMATE